MNLDMGSTVVSALATRGQYAGKATDGFDFDNHRWLRFRSFLQTLEEIVKPAGLKLTQARGQVYRCDVGFGLKPWLIVSNNARNRHTADVLAIGLTTTVRQLPTWVPLSSGDPLTGYANADNIETLGKDELGDHLGALTPETMTRVNRALAIALALAN
jgi:mRNA interferase MazF